MKHHFRISFLLISMLAGFSAFSQTNATNELDARLQIPATDDGLPGAGPIRRADWFKKTWLERRSAWEKRAEQDRHAVVFLGDSITQGWGDNMGGSFPGVKVANRGISGDTTRGVLIRMDEDVLALDPAAVVILIGTNDQEEKADPKVIAANLKLIIAKLEASNHSMPIILCEVFPSSETKHRPADKIKEINRLYDAEVKGDPQVTLVETWRLFANDQGDAKPEEFRDLLHPNKLGYAKWAAALHPIFATLGFMDNEPDDFTPEPGYVSLFNGHDLTGWGYIPTTPGDIKDSQRPGAPAWPIVKEAVNFDGKTASDDGRYVAKNGRLIVMAAPEYRRIQALWTTRDFPKDFILKLDFRSAVYADSGIFVRGPQLQCRDYITAGPYKDLKHYKPQDWNTITIEVKGNAALCKCNDEVMEAAMAVPATGPIGLEGDRGQMEYRHIELKELP
jgi:lysophospholipase L1-like esterase